MATKRTTKGASTPFDYSKPETVKARAQKIARANYNQDDSFDIFDTQDVLNMANTMANDYYTAMEQAIPINPNAKFGSYGSNFTPTTQTATYDKNKGLATQVRNNNAKLQQYGVEAVKDEKSLWDKFIDVIDAPSNGFQGVTEAFTGDAMQKATREIEEAKARGENPVATTYYWNALVESLPNLVNGDKWKEAGQNLVSGVTQKEDFNLETLTGKEQNFGNNLMYDLILDPTALISGALKGTAKGMQSVDKLADAGRVLEKAVDLPGKVVDKGVELTGKGLGKVGQAVANTKTGRAIREQFNPAYRIGEDTYQAMRGASSELTQEGATALNPLNEFMKANKGKLTDDDWATAFKVASSKFDNTSTAEQVLNQARSGSKFAVTGGEVGHRNARQFVNDVNAKAQELYDGNTDMSPLKYNELYRQVELSDTLPQDFDWDLLLQNGVKDMSLDSGNMLRGTDFGNLPPHIQDAVNVLERSNLNLQELAQAEGLPISVREGMFRNVLTPQGRAYKDLTSKPVDFDKINGLNSGISKFNGRAYQGTPFDVNQYVGVQQSDEFKELAEWIENAQKEGLEHTDEYIQKLERAQNLYRSQDPTARPLLQQDLDLVAKRDAEMNGLEQGFNVSANNYLDLENQVKQMEAHIQEDAQIKHGKEKQRLIDEILQAKGQYDELQSQVNPLVESLQTKMDNSSKINPIEPQKEAFTERIEMGNTPQNSSSTPNQTLTKGFKNDPEAITKAKNIVEAKRNKLDFMKQFQDGRLPQLEALHDDYPKLKKVDEAKAKLQAMYDEVKSVGTLDESLLQKNDVYMRAKSRYLNDLELLERTTRKKNRAELIANLQKNKAIIEEAEQKALIGTKESLKRKKAIEKRMGEINQLEQEIVTKIKGDTNALYDELTKAPTPTQPQSVIQEVFDEAGFNQAKASYDQATQQSALVEALKGVGAKKQQESQALLEALEPQLKSKWDAKEEAEYLLKNQQGVESYQDAEKMARLDSLKADLNHAKRESELYETFVKDADSKFQDVEGINDTIKEVYNELPSMEESPVFHADFMSENPVKSIFEQEKAIVNSATKNRSIKTLLESDAMIPKSAVSGNFPEKSYKEVTKSEMESWVKQWGIEMPEGFKAEAYYMPKEAYHMLTHFKNSNLNEGLEELLGVHDKIMNAFKGNALFSAGYHTRNITGNTQNLYLAGMEVADVVEGVKKGISTKRAFDQFEKNYSNAVAKGSKLSRNEFLAQQSDNIQQAVVNYDEFLKQTCSSTSRTRDEVGSIIREMEGERETGRFAKTRHAYNQAKEFNFKVSESVDMMFRYGAYEWAKQNPEKVAKTLGHRNGTANDFVNRALFDYGRMTETEKATLKRIAPFYSFLKFNTGYQFTNMFKNPRRVAKLSRVMDKTAEHSFGSETYDLAPDYVEGSGRISVGDNTMVNLGNPFKETFDLATGGVGNAFSTVTNATNPLIKAMFELSNGKSLFSGQDLKLDTPVDYAQYVASQIGGSPYRTLQALFDENKHGLAKIDPSNFSNYNPQKWEASKLYEQRDAQLALLEALKQ